MKKIFALLCLCLLLNMGNSIALAAEDNQPLISATNKKFDIFAATYVLKGDVHIQHKSRSVKADYAEYNMISQQVKANGNIDFSDGDFNASCQSLVAHILDDNVDLNGSVLFKKDNLQIRADSANFNWKTKLANFKGNVIIDNNGQQSRAESATYNVISGELKS